MTIERLPLSSTARRSRLVQGYEGSSIDDAAMFVAADSVQRIPISQVFTVFLRQKWLLLFSVLLINAAALAAIEQIKPYYDATAAVLIEASKSAFSDLQAAIGGTTTDTIALRTQADIIQSTAMASRVVDQLDLVHVGEFAEALKHAPSLLVSLQDRMRDLLQLPIAPARILTDREQRQLVVGLLQGKVSVSNVGRSYIMEIKVRTGDAELSAKIANAFAAGYVAFNRETKQAAIKRGTEMLDERLVPLRDRVRIAETATQKFREEHGIALSQVGDNTSSQAGGTTVASQQLSQINAQLSVATANLVQKEASLSSARSSNRRGSIYGIPEVVASPLIQRLREQEVQITSRQASLNAVPGADNPLLRSTRSELGDIRRQIDAEVGKIVESLRTEVAAATARRDSLQAQLNSLQDQVTTQNQAGIGLKQLESEADAARKVYRDFLSRFEQTSNQMALQEPDASVVSAAQPPLSRTGPPRLLYASLGVIISLILSAVLALLTNRLCDRSFRTLDQLQSHAQLIPLGLVPNLGGRNNARRQLRVRASRESLSLLHSILQRRKEVAVGGEGQKAGAQTILVTSALSGEGKTWVAASLASIAGRVGESVLLIDCDRHNPSIAKALGMSNLLNRAEERDSAFALRQQVLKGVDVITLAPGLDDGWSGLRNLLKTAREHYRLIILDTPPVLMCADAASLASAADGVVMVVRWGETPIVRVQAAVRTLQSVGAKLLGGMLTQVRLERLRGPETADAIAYGSYHHHRIDV